MSDTRFKTWLVIVSVCFSIIGCVAGLKYWGPVEKQRAKEQQDRGVNTSAMADNAIAAINDGRPEDAKQELKVISETGKEITTEAVNSERWATAGEKVLGSPPETVEPGTTGEAAVLGQLEGVAETVGKVRRDLDRVKNTLGVVARIAANPAGGVSGWVTGGGLMATLTAVGVLGKKGHSILKRQDDDRKREREEDREAYRKMQKERDEDQDEKLEALITMFRDRMTELENKVALQPGETPEETTTGTTT